MNPNVPKIGVDQDLESQADALLQNAGYNTDGADPVQNQAESDAWQKLCLEGDIRNNAEAIASKSGTSVESVIDSAPEMASQILGGEQPTISMNNPEQIGEAQTINPDEKSTANPADGIKTA